MWHRSGLFTGILLMSAIPLAGQSSERDSLARELALTMNVVATVQQEIAFPIESATIDSAAQRRMVAGTRGFVAKYFTPDIALSHVVPVYAKRFTEPELRQLLEFARSPAGARYLSGEAELRLIAARVSQSILRAHADELRELVRRPQ